MAKSKVTMTEQERFEAETQPHKLTVGNYSPKPLINQAEIEPIIALIRHSSAKPTEGKYYFEIAIPGNHAFDHDKILAFFSDATIYCERGRPNMLKGHTTDPNVGAYLFAKHRDRF